jgi:hypothetical protein
LRGEDERRFVCFTFDDGSRQSRLRLSLVQEARTAAHALRAHGLSRRQRRAMVDRSRGDRLTRERDRALPERRVMEAADGDRAGEISRL